MFCFLYVCRLNNVNRLSMMYDVRYTHSPFAEPKGLVCTFTRLKILDDNLGDYTDELNDYKQAASK